MIQDFFLAAGLILAVAIPARLGWLALTGPSAERLLALAVLAVLSLLAYRLGQKIAQRMSRESRKDRD